MDAKTARLRRTVINLRKVIDAMTPGDERRKTFCHALEKAEVEYAKVTGEVLKDGAK